MIAMLVVFYMFLSVFAIMGSMRGWAKELLVVFSVVLALAFIAVLENLLPVVSPMLTSNPTLQYWIRILIVILMTFFGYQSPKFNRLQRATEKRDRIQDLLLGLFMGVISGYFVYGTLWSFANTANYPLMIEYIQQPPPSLAEATQRILNMLPPVWLGEPPMIYIAVVVSFIFVIVVFI